MALFPQFPYTNYHQQNLDWWLAKMRETTDQLNKLTDTVEDTLADVRKLAQDEVAEAIKGLDIKGMSLAGKKVGFIGDSTIWGALTGGSRAEATIPSTFAQITGATVYNWAVKGAAIAYRSQYPDRELIVRQLANNQAQAAECDYIVVQGGVNDWSGSVPIGNGSEVGFVQSMVDTINYALSVTGGKPVVVLSMMPNKVWQMDDIMSRNDPYRSYNEYIKQACAKTGGLYCDISNIGMSEDVYHSDNLHLTAEGYKRVGEWLAYRFFACVPDTRKSDPLVGMTSTPKAEGLDPDESGFAKGNYAMLSASVAHVRFPAKMNLAGHTIKFMVNCVGGGKDDYVNIIVGTDTTAGFVGRVKIGYPHDGYYYFRVPDDFAPGELWFHGSLSEGTFVTLYDITAGDADSEDMTRQIWRITPHLAKLADTNQDYLNLVTQYTNDIFTCYFRGQLPECAAGDVLFTCAGFIGLPQCYLNVFHPQTGKIFTIRFVQLSTAVQATAVTANTDTTSVWSGSVSVPRFVIASTIS